MTLKIGDRVRIIATHEVGAVVHIERWFGLTGRRFGVEFASGYLGWYRAAELEPGHDLRPNIARLTVEPVMHLATTNFGEVV